MRDDANCTGVQTEPERASQTAQNEAAAEIIRDDPGLAGLLKPPNVAVPSQLIRPVPKTGHTGQDFDDWIRGVLDDLDD